MSMTLSGSNGITFNDASTQSTGKQACKAWVQFTAPTGTVTIKDSFNISSVTVTNTGCYTVAFTTAMPNANYSAVTSGANGGNNSVAGTASVFVNSTVSGNVAPTSASFLVQYRAFNGTAYHADYCCVSVFSS